MVRVIHQSKGIVEILGPFGVVLWPCELGSVAYGDYVSPDVG